MVYFNHSLHTIPSNHKAATAKESMLGIILTEDKHTFKQLVTQTAQYLKETVHFVLSFGLMF